MRPPVVPQTNDDKISLSSSSSSSSSSVPWKDKKRCQRKCRLSGRKNWIGACLIYEQEMWWSIYICSRHSSADVATGSSNSCYNICFISTFYFTYRFAWGCKTACSRRQWQAGRRWWVTLVLLPRYTDLARNGRCRWEKGGWLSKLECAVYFQNTDPKLLRYILKCGTIHIK